LPRIVTYNVHRCQGPDGRTSPERIAEIIAALEPDIVALQELDVRRARSGGVDQAHRIASVLGMEMHFHPAMKVMEELYGDAILTPHPSRLVKAAALPGFTLLPGVEPRGALWAAIEIQGVRFQTINTHLGLLSQERQRQLDVLLGPDWLEHPECREPVILLGDFNAIPASRAYRRLARRLRDAQLHAGAALPMPTFPGRLPLLRIDHVFVGPTITVAKAQVVRTALTQVASDHLPLLVEFEVAPAGAGAAREHAFSG